MAFQPDQPGRGFALDPELEQILLTLVDAALSRPRAERTFWVHLVDAVPGAMVMGGGLEDTYAVAEHDLEELKRYGLLRSNAALVGPEQLYVTEEGYWYADAAKQRAEPLETIEHDVETYLDADRFKSRYGEAHAKWRQAASYLAADPVEHATRIGHDCRDALQAFATALVARHGLQDQDLGGGTVDSVRTVLNAHRDRLGKTVHAFLDALLAYWGTVSDLAQRQEHGAQKEGEALDAEDARRVVFYTALVMYELDRSLPAA
jgi:hypothetical protein